VRPSSAPSTLSYLDRDWRATELGNVITLQRGFDLPADERKPGSVPIVSSSGIFGRHSEARVKAPGVVTGRYGTIGQVFFVEKDFWPLNTTLFVKDFKGNDPLFVSYLLRTIDFASCSDKSSVPGVNRNHLHGLKVLVPGVAEQKAIAKILGALDDKIELNRRMNETLEAMARAIFKSWFVDFDPVRAKMEGRWKRGQSLPGLPAHLFDLFPDSFQDSPLGKIPKGWRVGTVGEEFTLTMGQSPPGSTYNELGEGTPFFQGRADFGFRFPTERVYCTAATRFASAGDTLVSVRAPVGDINMAAVKCAIGRGVAALRHKTGSRSFTYYAMKNLQDEFGSFEAEGTVFGSISKEGFAGIPWVAPPVSLIERFESIAFPFDQAIENAEDESKTLAAIRDALLPKLISGEIRVGVNEDRVIGQ
jgi:type I restriction enzyme S subunit